LGISEGMLSLLTRSAFLHWAITFGLLGVVLGGFAFLGTEGEGVSLSLYSVALVFIGLAVAMIVIVPRLNRCSPVHRSLRRVIRFLKA
jgi:hypothetical protein